MHYFMLSNVPFNSFCARPLNLDGIRELSFNSQNHIPALLQQQAQISYVFLEISNGATT